MSLRGVHLIFIIASIALALFMTVWAVGMYTSGGGTASHLVTAGVSFSVGAALVVYAVRFVRKARSW